MHCLFSLLPSGRRQLCSLRAGVTRLGLFHQSRSSTLSLPSPTCPHKLWTLNPPPKNPGPFTSLTSLYIYSFVLPVCFAYLCTIQNYFCIIWNIFSFYLIWSFSIYCTVGQRQTLNNHKDGCRWCKNGLLDGIISTRRKAFVKKKDVSLLRPPILLLWLVVGLSNCVERHFGLCPLVTPFGNLKITERFQDGMKLSGWNWTCNQ